MWSEEEKKAVHQFLGKFFVSAKLPGKALCLEAKSKAAVLSHRPWQQIKFYIKNHKVVWDSQYIQQLDNTVWLNFNDIRQYILLCVTYYSTRISVKYVILNHRKCYVQRWLLWLHILLNHPLLCFFNSLYIFLELSYISQ